ncbi:uncharacterized protein LOC106056012 [Biomphalaria glabrata]|uniref:Uncharacterized protein LOC106056012 n=1 Tax=Biomphalaria glabrata TaxID=6526 RepID=A0A9W2ZCA6_BIOGL|nr:uncharacterized protein LOC106056012 [Biomphalaria glabrata]XP_055872532.1 uncharacterized protein LOC106056012 [Biomphalaria glabrata]
MSLFPAADIRPKSYHIGCYGGASTQVTSTISPEICTFTHSEPSPTYHYSTHAQAGQLYYDNVGPRSKNTRDQSSEFRVDPRSDQVSYAFRQPYSNLNVQNPACASLFDVPKSAAPTVRIPQGPKSCPPCSPVTRIVHSVSADGTSSPGTKTVTFEVAFNVSDDHINSEVQALREKLERQSQQVYEDIPIIQLKAPPKGRGKRPLSSDSDSFSSDLASSSVSLNSSAASDTFQKLKSPEEFLASCSLAAMKSPKKLKADSENSTPFGKAPGQHCMQVAENDSAKSSLQRSVFNFPQTPNKSDAFCSTPLQRISGDLNAMSTNRQNCDVPITTNETQHGDFKRVPSMSVLPLTNDFQIVSESPALPKRSPAPKVDVQNRPSISNTPAKLINNSTSHDLHLHNNNKGGATIQETRSVQPNLSERPPTRQRRNLEPNVFIFPEVKTPSNEDEVDGFGSDDQMETDNDNYEYRQPHFGQQNMFMSRVPGHDQRYGQYSSANQTQFGHNWQGQGIQYNSIPNFGNNKVMTPSHFSNTGSHFYQREEENFSRAGSKGRTSHDRYCFDDIDSAGTSQSRQRKLDSDILRTPKDNRTKMTSVYEDVLDVADRQDDVEHALEKFSDQDSRPIHSMPSKQDFNNNSRNSYGNSRLSEERSNVVSTKANTNVCYVSLDELPDSDMSCDEIEEYSEDSDDARSSDYLPVNVSGRRQRSWDETDGLTSGSRPAKNKKKGSVHRKDNLTTVPGSKNKLLPQSFSGRASKSSGQQSLSSTKVTTGTSFRHPFPEYHENTNQRNSEPEPSRNIIPKVRKDNPYKNDVSIDLTSKSVAISTIPSTERSFKNDFSDTAKVKSTRKVSEINPSIGAPIHNTHNYLSHSYEEIHRLRSHPEFYNPKQETFKYPAKHRKANSWIPVSTGSRHKDKNDEDEDDEVDGLGDDKDRGPTTDKPGSSSVSLNKDSNKDADDVVHCFDSSDDEGKSSRRTSSDRDHKTASHSSDSKISQPMYHTQTRKDVKEFTKNHLANYVAVNSESNAVMSKPVTNRYSENWTTMSLRTEHKTTSPSQESFRDEPNLYSCAPSTFSENRSRTKQYPANSKDDIGVSCFSSQELKDLFPRRASDTSGRISPTVIIPRTRSSPSKLENSSSEKLKRGQQAFHRPWVSPENKGSFMKHSHTIQDMANFLDNQTCQTNASNFNRSNGSTQGDQARSEDTSEFQLIKNSRTPDNVYVARYSSTSDPNRYSDPLRTDTAGACGYPSGKNKRPKCVGTPAKRNRVDRRLDFGNTHKSNENSQPKLSTSSPTVRPNTSLSNLDKAANSATSAEASAPETCPESSPMQQRLEKIDFAAGASSMKNDESIETAGLKPGYPQPEKGAQLRKLQNILTSREESGSSRHDNEIDIKIEVSDSLKLSERLEQIYQSNDMSCECARIEQDILGKAMSLFKELCDPNKKFDNWKASLRDTNAVIRESLDMADTIRRICSHGRTIEDVLQGSVILRLKCRTLMSVVDLCQMYSSGELHVLLSRMLCTRVQMKGLALKVSLDPANVQRCIRFLFRAVEVTVNKKKVAQPHKQKDKFSHGLIKDVKSSPCTPTFRVSTHARCSSSPALHTVSPLCTPTPITEKRERTSSFGETRIAFQELHLSDKDCPTSPLGSSSRWNCSPKLAPSPMTPLRRVASPHLRTSPMTSPVTSPRKLNRCDVIQEQENMGDGSVQ